MDADVDAREEEEFKPATMLRGNRDQPEDDEGEIMAVETINVTSANGASKPNILKRKAALECLQEMCLSEEMRGAFKNEAKDWRKTFIGGPTGPEKVKAAAGLGFWRSRALTSTTSLSQPVTTRMQ